jgi:hypothetical protein
MLKLVAVVWAVTLIIPAPSNTQGAPEINQLWSAAYWATWSHYMEGDPYHEGRTLRADSVDWSALNLIIHHIVTVKDTITCDLDTTTELKFQAERI